MTAYKAACTPAHTSNHERAHRKTPSTSLQITQMMEPDRVPEEKAGTGDK